MKKLRGLLDFINESIGKRPIASISAQELLVMLRKMESKGCYERPSGYAAPVHKYSATPMLRRARDVMLQQTCAAR